MTDGGGDNKARITSQHFFLGQCIQGTQHSVKTGNSAGLLDRDLQNVSRGHCWREEATDCHGNNAKESKCDKFSLFSTTPEDGRC